MLSDHTKQPVPGWVGGFAQSKPAFAYPNPNLTSLPMLGNMDNIKLLQRQQGAEWPEFSWETVPGDPNSRCFQRFAHYISRIGYTNAGRIYSIICPQQGIYIEGMGYLNVEATVTGQRGWIDEDTREIAADMTVEGKVWLGPSAHKSSLGAELLALCTRLGYPFPSKKSEAIIVATYEPGNPDQPIFPVRYGETSNFPIPDFARHTHEAWSVANIEVEIGQIQITENPEVNAFNELIMELFNIGSGNMLKSGNTLAWNVWLKAPGLVNQKEWADHAQRWRDSIDEDHGSPGGPGTPARYFDGTPFSPAKALVEEVIEKILSHLKGRL